MSAATDEILEKLKSLTLLEASELVKQIEEAFGVSASAPSGGMMMMAPGGAAPGGAAGVDRLPVPEQPAHQARPDRAAGHGHLSVSAGRVVPAVA